MHLIWRSIFHVFGNLLRHLLHFLLALLALLVLALAALLASDSGRSWTAQMGIVLANQYSDWYIQAQDVRSPGLTHWEVGNLRLYPPEAGQTAININNLAVEFPFNQWEVPFTVDRLSADSVTVYLDRLRAMPTADTEQETDPLALVQAGPPQPDFGLWLHELTIGDLRLHDSQGEPLTGPVNGQLSWPGGDSLPEISLHWGDDGQPLLSVSGGPEPEGQRWRLDGDLSLPPNTWAHDLTQWPINEPLSARISLALDLEHLGVSVYEVSLPWEGHALTLSGELSHDEPDWVLSDGALTVDDHVSTLSGRVGPEVARIDGLLDLPLTLIAGFLPDDIRPHTIDPGDRLHASLSAAQGEPWQLLARTRTRWHAQSLSLSVNASGQNLQIDDLRAELNLGDSQLSVRGDWHLMQHQGQLTVAAALAEDVAAPYWQDALFQGARLQGTLDGMGRDADDQINWPRWQGDITARGEMVTDTALTAIPWTASATTELDYPTARWEGLELGLAVATEQAGLASRGEVDLAQQRIDAHWQLQELPIAPVLSSLMDWPDGLTAAITGSGDVRGPLDDPSGNLQLSGNGQFQGQPWQLSVDAPLVSQQQIVVDSIDGQWLNSRVHSALTLRPDLEADWTTWPVQADITPLELELADLTALLPEWPPELSTGELLTSVSVRGVLGNPDIMVQSRLNADYLGEPLTGSVNWQADRIQADINWQDRALSLEGRGRPWDSGAWTLEAQRIRTEDLAAWIELPGELGETDLQTDLTIHLDGGLDETAIRISTRHAGNWEQQALSAASAASVWLSNGELDRWELDAFDAAWSDAHLNATAISLENDWLPAEFDLDVSDFPLHLFAPLPDMEAYGSGQASLDANWPDWDVLVNLQLVGQQGDDELEGDFRSLIQGSGNTLKLIDLQELALQLGDRMSVTGSGGLAEDDWDLSLDWSGVSWAPPVNMPLPGELWEGEGSIRLSGQGDDPDIEAHTEWTTQWVTADSGEQLDLTFSAQLRTTSDQLSLAAGLRRPGKELLLAGVETERLSVSERMERPWTDWDISAFWELDFDTDEVLYWLGQEQVQIAGQIAGDGVVQGTLGTPSIDGSLRWENGALRIPQANAEFDEIDLTLTASDNERLQVDGSARAGNGRIDLGGDLVLRDGELTSDVRLTLNRAAVVQRADVQTLASGELTLTGTTPDWLLAGELRLIDLTVNINRLAGPSVPQLEIADERNGAGFNGGGGNIPLAIDIGISTDGTATIRGNGIDARMSGELRLGGTLTELESDGALTIESGTFNLLTRRFDLQEGQLRLVDEAIDVYIVAVHQTREVMVEATIRGNADQLQLSLRSEPSLPEDEIVAQLLFGKTVQNMTPWQALQLANAINQLSGGDSIDLFLATRETLGLDTLELAAPEEDGEAATLRVGRYLNSRVYLELDTDLDEDRAWQGSVEVELTPNLSLETFTSSGGGGGGLELRWRRDY